MISLLIESAIRSTVLALAVGAILCLCRVRDAGIRLAAWTTVLCGVLLLPFLGAVLPRVAIPAIPSAPIAKVTTLPITAYTDPGMIRLPTMPQTHSLDWIRIAETAYTAIAGLLLVRFGFGLFLTRRVRRKSRRIEDQRLLGVLAQQAAAAGIRKSPALMESGVLAVPITIGWTHPRIILPPAWREWNESKIGVVLAHELSHVRRGDYATLLLSSLNRCMFWFSPLSWWLDRQLRELAELVSDDSALRAGSDRTHYAEVLLGFFEAMRNQGGRVRWQGVSMARSGNAHRRIDRILAANRKLSAPAPWPVLLGVAVLTTPLLYLSAAAQSTPKSKPNAAPAASTSAPPALDSYVIVSGDSATMSGSRDDLRHAQGFRYRVGEEYVWFRQGGKSYIVRDPNTVKAAIKLFQPQQDLGRQQGELGEQQGKLGELQAKIGERLSSIRTTLPDLTRDIERLRQKIRGARTSEELGELQAMLGEIQAKIGDQQAKIGEQQAKIGEEQAKLGEEQAKLGERQAALGELQAKQAEEAGLKLKALLEEVLKKGLAEPALR
jgi:beta-lactamase regulating signal transducer with metallopeptidase domain